jgi:hypothetical protein
LHIPCEENHSGIQEKLEFYVVLIQKVFFP